LPLAATELSLFLSFNDGDSWQPLQLNLPHVSMRDMAVHDNDLIVATHGRGFRVLDDITPLRQITDEVARSSAFLFEPEDAYNLPQPTENATPQPKDEPLADNQPYGAIIDYYHGTQASGSVT